MSAAKPERKSMKGMGADAFFGPPVDQPTTEEVNHDTSKPVQQDTTTEASRDTALPDYQWSSVEGESDTDLEIEQQSSLPAKKITSKPVKRGRGKVASQPDDTGFMKASYYITVEDDLKLENIRLARRKRGIKVDKSALIREAIAKLRE